MKLNTFFLFVLFLFLFVFVFVSSEGFTELTTSFACSELRDTSVQELLLFNPVHVDVCTGIQCPPHLVKINLPTSKGGNQPL